MRPSIRLSIIALIASGALLLAGCTDDGPSSAPMDPKEPNEPEPQEPEEPRVCPTVMGHGSIDAAPERVMEGDSVSITWTVRAGGCGDGPIEGELRWGSANMTSASRTAYTLIASYSAAGTWTDSFTAPREGPIEVVTFVNEGSWERSNSATIHVEELDRPAPNDPAEQEDPPTDPPTVHHVEIGASGAGPLAEYGPDPITIAVGDQIVWHNNDTAGLPHTASSTDGPDSFNSGNVVAGASSDPITFTKVGTYTYRCNIHPSTMSGAQVIVEA